MNLEEKINNDIRDAMKSKDQAWLRGARAIKAAILLAKTDGSGLALDQDREIKLLQKLVKQRQDSLAIYEAQNRADLAQVEREEIEIIQRYLPQPVTGEELESFIRGLIQAEGASGIKDMGRIMGLATKGLSGKADGKTISEIVKKLLTA
ncbi:MAG TPA: GatB/YqeY domain-containing protein [Saprospiraceae bacterium]|nr:GatB/YqeY domain-containing protein [Saprospiraceae bacterium]HNT21882.1 GatB/YqeY domain-containing protein [Saprospiraceae bacterium]